MRNFFVNAGDSGCGVEGAGGGGGVYLPAPGAYDSLMRRAAALSFFSLLVLFCQKTLAEEADRVMAIEIRGNERVKTDAIREKISHPVEAPLDPEQVREDIREVFSLGVFSNITVSLEEEILIFLVEEEPPLGKILFVGDMPLREKKMRRLLGLKPGEPLHRAHIKKRADFLEESLKERGYHFAEVSWEAKPPPDGEAQSAVDVAFTIKSGARVRVAAVRFSGNSALTREELLEKISTRPRGRFAQLMGKGFFWQKALENDLLQLEALYLDWGYVDARVGEPVVTWNEERTEAEILIPVEEGERYQVRDVALSDDFPEVGEVRGKLKVKPGDYFSRALLAEDLLALSTAMRDAGYANASAVPQTVIDRGARKIDIRYVLSRGEKVYIERIEVRGNRKTADWVIRRELGLSEGELYSESRLSESRMRLLRLGFFEAVDFTSKVGRDPRHLILEVRVKEREYGNVQLGFGSALYQDAVLGSLGLSVRNLFGRGHWLDLSWISNQNQQLLSLSLREPRFLGSRTPLVVEAFYATYALPALSWATAGGRVQFAYPLGEKVWGYGIYSLYQESEGLLPFVAGELPEELVRFGRRGGLEAGFLYDTRDDRFFPKRGWYLYSGGEVFAAPLGSTFGFLRGGASLSGSVPLGRSGDAGVIFRFLGRAGGITALSPGEEIPYTERYFPGGLGSVRGFTARSLGPRLLSAEGGEGLVIGGTRELVFSLEAELPLSRTPWLRSVRWAAFADAGNAFGGTRAAPLAPPQTDFGAFPLRTSLGLGLRWYFPLLPGPLRLELAGPLDPKTGERRLVFHFSMGTRF